MKNIILTRSLDVRCWGVVGQVARAAKRPELMPVLIRARERGKTDAEDVASHLLFEARSRRVVAQRLLAIAEGYKLLELQGSEYVLTELGRTALATELVFVPEEGTWTVWASDDLLLDSPILWVEPWVEPSAYDELLGQQRDQSRDRPFEPLPAWLRNACGVASTPLAGDGAQIRIDRLEASGVCARSDSSLRVVWDVSSSRLRVEGTLADDPVNAAGDAPEVGVEDVWRQLLQSEDLWSQWDTAAHALRIGFEEATAGERESLVRAVAFKRPRIEKYGTFSATTVEGVALRARSAQDAARWVEWRLSERVRDYATAERFSAWTAEAVAPFSEFNPSTPDRQTLAMAGWRTRTDRPTPRTWHLVAAEDWRL